MYSLYYMIVVMIVYNIEPMANCNNPIECTMRVN